MKDCLKGIKPYLGNKLIRNITYQDCERWLIGRGKELKASAYFTSSHWLALWLLNSGAYILWIFAMPDW